MSNLSSDPNVFNKWEVNFEEGNEVWLNIKNFRLPEGLNQKISYVSPFNVLEKKFFSIYKVELPENLKVHPIFHVSLLKPVMLQGLIENTIQSLYLTSLMLQP
jgi:hypothetical protein